MTKMSLGLALYRWFTEPPTPSYLNPRPQPADDAVTIIHSTTQYLLDIQDYLSHGTYHRLLHQELTAHAKATFAAVDIYHDRYTKGAP